MAMRVRSRSFRDRRGTVALVFALTIVPILVLAGLVIDAGMAITARSELDLAADAAALAAVTAAVNDLPTDSSNYLTVGKTAGANRFLAQAGSIASLTKNTPTSSVVRSGNTVQATITWTASYTPFFGGLLGANSFSLSGTASANAPIGAGYTDIYILFDNSSSMELPSAADGITKLQSATSNACAYACHNSNSTNSSWNNNYDDAYGLARYKNIELRFDVVISTLKLMVAAIQSSNSGGTYRIGIYTFDKQLNQTYPPSSGSASVSSDISSAMAAINTIAIPFTSGASDTNFSKSMDALTKQIGIAGDGTTASSPRKFLFILTDGVEDAKGNMGNRTVTVMDANACTTAKANDVTVSVLYTTYLPFEGETSYDQWVKPIQSLIEPALKPCASSLANYTSASDGPAIKSSLLQMLQTAITSPARLTQ